MYRCAGAVLVYLYLYLYLYLSVSVFVFVFVSACLCLPPIFLLLALFYVTTTLSVVSVLLLHPTLSPDRDTNCLVRFWTPLLRYLTPKAMYYAYVGFVPSALPTYQ